MESIVGREFGMERGEKVSALSERDDGLIGSICERVRQEVRRYARDDLDGGVGDGCGE